MGAVAPLDQVIGKIRGVEALNGLCKLQPGKKSVSCSGFKPVSQVGSPRRETLKGDGLAVGLLGHVLKVTLVERAGRKQDGWREMPRCDAGSVDFSGCSGER